MPYGSRGCKISKIGIVLRLLAAALILASPWMGLRGNPWIGFGYCLTVILLFVVARYYSKRANFSAD